MPRLKKYKFTQSGMWPDANGEYCLVADVGLDIQRATEYAALNKRLKALGHVSLEAMIEKMEFEQAAQEKTAARIFPEPNHRQYFKVPSGETERGFPVVRVKGHHGQLQVDDKMDIWVEFVNFTPTARTTVYIDHKLRITRMSHV